MIAIINNSSNIDMQKYLNAKRRIISKDIIFAQNIYCKRENYNDLVSSISLKNKPSLRLLADFFISLFLGIKLRLKKVTLIIFDSAHISNIPLALVAKLLKIKLIFTIHDWMPHEGKMCNATKIYNYFTINFFADHIICFSRIDSDISHSVLTLSGYEYNFESVLPANDLFVFFGRIEPYKGLENLIPIAKRLNILMPNAKIKIMGAGFDASLKELNKLHNIEISNKFVSEKELNNLLKSATAVLIPYNSATQSGVLLKSFSQGVPVVAFDVGAIGSYLQDGYDGYLVKHKDFDNFCDKMLEISKNRSFFYENIKSSFEHRYGIKALVEQYEQLLEDLS